MNERVQKILEFSKIVDKLKSFAVSASGRKRLDEMEILTRADRCEAALAGTAAAKDAIERLGNPPLHHIFETAPLMTFAEKGGVLDPEDLLNVADFARSSADMHAYGEETDPILRDDTSRLPVLGTLVNAIERAILSPTEIADDASPELFRIRREKANKEREVRTKLDDIVRRDGTLLTDAFVTIREDRYVLPVRAEYKNRFPGIVHDSSSSGQTAFIEPLAVVRINNEIRDLMIREDEEIRRILRNLTEKVFGHADELEMASEILTHLDVLFAKAKLALEMRANKPHLTADEHFELIGARHPMIDPDVVVPITIGLDEDTHSLVITGPNTGGKTVTLKTVGLLHLMVQAGLFIPADEESTVRIFREIYADIGDEQSIEQSLSTFSGHMKNIVSILDVAERSDLVLLDELGQGTDPTEGAALAMAILEHLREEKVSVLATTHYSELKTYALTTQGVRNASVEFDVKTLRPTYRVLIDTPGKSNAFAISERLGLSHKLIERAEGMIGEEERKKLELFSHLEEERAELEQTQALAKKHAREIERLRNELEIEREKNERTRERIFEKAREEAENIVRETQEESKELIRELKSLDRLDQKSRARKMQQIMERLREKERRFAKDEPLLEHVDQGAWEPKIGDSVEIVSMGERGTLASLPDSKGKVTVAVGILKFQTDLETLRPVDAPDEVKNESTIRHVLKGKAASSVSSKIDLRGKTIEEAILDLDKYIDDCILFGMNEATVIHGKGTGMLKKGLREYMKKHPHIASMRDGALNEGADGVTIVRFR